MKKDYEVPVIEIVEFQDEGIATGSTLDVGVGDWFSGEDD